MRKKKNTLNKTKPNSYSMPHLAGLYTKPPYRYTDITQILIQFKTDSNALKCLVPEPITPNENNEMFLSVSNMLGAGFGHYLEAHLFTTGRFKRQLVNYSVYLILDNDVATGGGREIWGWPKKIGRLTFKITDDVVRSTTERGGITIIDAAVKLEKLGSSEDVSGTPNWICHKVIPSVSNKLPNEVDQLTMTTLKDISIGDVHSGPATLNFNASPADNLDKIPVLDVLGGFYFQSKFVLFG